MERAAPDGGAARRHGDLCLRRQPVDDPAGDARRSHLPAEGRHGTPEQRRVARDGRDPLTDAESGPDDQAGPDDHRPGREDHAAAAHDEESGRRQRRGRDATARPGTAVRPTPSWTSRRRPSSRRQRRHDQALAAWNPARTAARPRPTRPPPGPAADLTRPKRSTAGQRPEAPAPSRAANRRRRR